MKIRTIKSKGKSGPINYKMLTYILLLLTIGCVMVFSASMYYSLYAENDLYFFLKKEMQMMSIGLIAMTIMIFIDYRNLKKISYISLFLSIILLLLVFTYPSMNGARRWIRAGGMSFQPSEFAKYGVVLFLSFTLDKYKNSEPTFKRNILSNLGMVTFVCLLILLENNLSMAAIIFIVAYILIYLGGTKIKHLLLIVPFGITGLIYAITFQDYRLKRYMSFLDPWADPTGDSYQLIRSFYAIGSGGLSGVGLGQSKMKALFIPEPHNDFIFSIIGEEFGFIGCAVVIVLFILFVYEGFKIAVNCNDLFAKLLSSGIVIVIAVQALINIAVVTGSMPVTGVPLPFISYGGTALVTNLASIGVLLNISKYSNACMKCSDVNSLT